jgi:hypothetical protein
MPVVVPFFTFVALASPQAFKATSGIFGPWVANSEGVPSIAGLCLHAIVFLFLSWILVRVVSLYETRDDQDDQNTKSFQQNLFLFNGKSRYI